MRLEGGRKESGEKNLRGDVPGGRPARNFPARQAFYGTTAWASIHCEDHHLSVIVLIFGLTLELKPMLVKKIMARERKKPAVRPAGLKSGPAPRFLKRPAHLSESGLTPPAKLESVSAGAFGMRSRAGPVLHAASAALGVGGHLMRAAGRPLA